MLAAMNATSLSAYEAREAPRFTSYPTAPHFSDAIGPDRYGEWLSQRPPQESLSLYVHVPFCAALCLYCGCQTAVVRNDAPVAAYADLLSRELDLVIARLPNTRLLSHLHFGGGTPTMLTALRLEALIGRIRREFTVEADAEIAIEADPRIMTTADIAAFARSGVTRVSLGVQTFDPKVQRTVRREQSLALTRELSEGLRRAGIRGLNFDLMFGLPHQSVANVVESVKLALELAPDRIALFGYAHVPWMKRHQALLPEQALPGIGERRAQFEAAAASILEAGYLQIGMDHFARPDDEMALLGRTGALRRNFQGYTTDRSSALLGLGASAISALPEGYAQNYASVPDYRAAILRGRLATVRGVALAPDDKLRAEIIQRLMCDFSADIGALCQEHGLDVATLAPDLQRLRPMIEDGLVTYDGGLVAIRPEARHLVRVMAAAFDAYAAHKQTRHSAVA